MVIEDISQVEVATQEPQLHANDASPQETMEKNASEQGNYIAELENQIGRMKEKAMEEEMNRLSEENASLKMKLELLNQVSNDLNEVQVKIAVLESEKQQWLSFLNSLPEGDRLVQNPYELGRVLAKNEAEIQLLNEKLNRLQEQSKEREEFLAGLERRVVDRSNEDQRKVMADIQRELRSMRNHFLQPAATVSSAQTIYIPTTPTYSYT